jgi:sucrose phosphorylase
VVDFDGVDPALGGWDDVRGIAADFEVMLDVVLNHASAKNPWLAGFLAGDPEFQRHFIEVTPGTDLTDVVRPRAKPLLTIFDGAAGRRLLWTTFSPDQVDLNYRNPRVLHRMLDVILGYLDHGATFLRLDAIGYAWKDQGTSCLNLPGTHHLVRAIRAAVDAVAPGAAIVTETNVPQPENVAYFGDGVPEARIVYQFSLPPLVLHALLFGTAQHLAQWIDSLEAPPPGCAFLNMVATHDGIGLMPATGLLSETEISDTVDRVLAHGGLVSMRDTRTDPRPYELNTTLFDALSDPSSDQPEEVRVGRHLAANSVMLSLSGIPGIYVHSLFGSSNDRAAADDTGIPRRINRRRFQEEELDAELSDPSSRASRVFGGFERLLRARASHPAFHPDSPQSVLDAPGGVLAVERGSGRTGRVRCLVNLTSEPRTVPAPDAGIDMLSGVPISAGSDLRLSPYDIVWLAEPGSPPEE